MKQSHLKGTLGLTLLLVCTASAAIATDRPCLATGEMVEAPAGVIGDVVAIDDYARSRLLTVWTDSGATVSIVVDEATEVKRVPAGERSIENAYVIAASEIESGDLVYARGAHPDGSGTARARQLIVMSRNDK